MSQLALFNTPSTPKVVNVASVPQRSPFRYPGGKTWLIPRIREWFASMDKRPFHLIEPFAGGGIVSLTAAFEALAERVTMVEMDDGVGAVWKTIVNGDAEWLVEKIVSFELTPENVQARLTQEPTSTQEKALNTILKNRCFRGGILAHGSGLLKYGENGKGIRSRWYPETLKKRILNIIEVRDTITFIQGDGIEVLKKHRRQKRAVVFIDPPYTAGGKKAGRRLYTHSEIDHEELFRVASSLAGDFLMTYDDADEIREMAARFKFETKLIPMKNTHHATMYELIIGRDLSWMV